MLWLIDFARAMPWKINWATAYGKLLIILLIKTGNNNFWHFFFHNNYWNTYTNIFTLISSIHTTIFTDLVAHSYKLRPENPYEPRLGIPYIVGKQFSKCPISPPRRNDLRQISEIASGEHNWTIPIKKLLKLTLLNIKFATFSENYPVENMFPTLFSL